MLSKSMLPKPETNDIFTIKNEFIFPHREIAVPFEGPGTLPRITIPFTRWQRIKRRFLKIVGKITGKKSVGRRQIVDKVSTIAAEP